MEHKEVKISFQIKGQYVEITRKMGWGDNPVFYAQQVNKVLDDAKKSIWEMIEAEHGVQYAEPPLNGL